MFTHFNLVLFFFIICTILSNVLAGVGQIMFLLLAIFVAVLFSNYCKYLYLFLLYCFFTTNMYSGSFLFFTFDNSVTYLGMTNISNISFAALFLINIGRIFSKRRVKINFYNPIIVCLMIFIVTQFIAVITSSDFSVSIQRFNQLPPYIIFFYLSLIYFEQIEIEYLLKFLGNI